jgi:hypothetical protein
MKRIQIYNTHLDVFCCGWDGACTHVEKVFAECDMAQGECECGNCEYGFHLVFPREIAGDLQYSHFGISGELLDVICPNPSCKAKGWIIVNETLPGSPKQSRS